MLEIYPATSFCLPNLPAQAHFPVTVISPLTHRIVLFIEEYHPWGVSVAASSFEYIPPLLFEAAPNVILRTSSQSAIKGITVSAPLGLYPQFPSASCPNDRPPKSLFSRILPILIMKGFHHSGLFISKKLCYSLFVRGGFCSAPFVCFGRLLSRPFLFRL